MLFSARPGNQGRGPNSDICVPTRRVQAIGQLRPYAVTDPNARAHLLNMLEKLNEAVADPEHRASIDVERRRVAPGVATDGQ